MLDCTFSFNFTTLLVIHTCVLFIFQTVSATEQISAGLDKLFSKIVVLHASGTTDKPLGAGFIRNTLFTTDFYVHISVDDYRVLEAAEQNKTITNLRPKVLIYNVENSGPDAKCTICRKLITLYRIPVIVHLADEFKG